MDLSGAVGISGHLYNYVDILIEKVFIGCEKKTVHQFALAIGIAGEKKLKRSDWQSSTLKNPSTGLVEEIPEVNPGSQMSTHPNITAILNILKIQGSLGDSKPNEIISEYINGGLAYLQSINFEDQSEESQELFLQEFPHLSDESDD